MDRTLEQAVLSALRTEPLIDAAHIFVTVRDGQVTLSGEVETNSQKSAARSKAGRIAGVREVVDELEVRAAKPRRGGDDIAASVLNALYWDLAVPSDRVCAKCEKGWVTLTGEVDRPYQKSSAEADVRRIRGVVGVTNEIKVGSGGSRKADAILLTEPMAAIAEDRKTVAGRRAQLS